MKYSKNAITQLKRQYKSVLLKCALINAALFMAAAPAMAANGFTVGAGTTHDTTAADSGTWFYNHGTVNNGVTLGDYSTIDNYSDGVFNNLAAGVFDNTNYNHSGFIRNMGEFNNAGTIKAYDFNNYNAGRFINSGIVDVSDDFYFYYNDSYDAPSGNYDGPSLVNSGTIYGSHFYIEDGNAENKKGGTITALCSFNIDDSTFINAGTATGFWVDNEGGVSYNTGTMNGLAGIENDYNGIFYNSGNVLGTWVENEYATFYNTGTVESKRLTVDDVKNIAGEDNLIKYYKHSYGEDDWNAWTTDAERTAALDSMIKDELDYDDETDESFVVNKGTFLNGVGVTITADGEDVTEEYMKPREAIAVVEIGDIDDFDDIEEPAMPQVMNWKFSGTTGTIKGDIMNGSYYYYDNDYSSDIIGSPFGSGYLLWSNGTIEGNIYNTAKLVNGVAYDRTHEYPESSGESGFVIPEVTIEFDAVSDAIIKSDAILNTGTIINGGQIESSIIVNNFRLENGWIAPEYSEAYMGIREVSAEPAFLSGDDDDDGNFGEVSDELPASEPVLLPDATITAAEIYNSGFIQNAGTIKGDVINYGTYDEEYGYSYGGPAAIAMHNATIDGNVTSKLMTEAELETLQEDHFHKFNYLMINSDDESEDIEESPYYDWSKLYGSMQTFAGDNTVTGSVSIWDVTVRPETSLTIGGDLTTAFLSVGYDESYDDDYMLVTSVDDSAETTAETVAPSRLDIGTGKAQIGDAYFGPESTLALTVESEEKFGQMIAGDFNIEEGAKLEVTVLPGFSDEEEHTLQLLAVDNNLMMPQADDDITPPSSEITSPESEVTSGSEDVSESEDEGGFNKFTDSFVGADGEDVIANNMFEIKRVDDEGNYSFKQIKKAEEIIEEPDPINPTPSEPSPAPHKSDLSGMAKAWIDDGLMTTPASLEMQKLLTDLAQNHSRKELADNLKALAPGDNSVSQATSAKVMGRVFSGVGAHLSKPKSGLASGDALNGVSAWGSTYYGSAKLDDRADNVYGFDSDSKGITVGADKQITPEIKLGLGLQYDKSDIDAFLTDIDVETAAAFGYGEYRLNNWYMSGVAAYGRSDYDEKSSVSNKIVKANYKADLFALQGLTGYDFITRYAEVSPNVGLRYNYIKRHGYEDSANQQVSGCDGDILTGVVGVRFAKNYSGFRPSAYVNLTYDMISDRDNATVKLPNGASYSVSGKRLNQFGTEAGAALEYNNGSWTLTASYDYNTRKHFNSHLGMLTAKYSF